MFQEASLSRFVKDRARRQRAETARPDDTAGFPLGKRGPNYVRRPGEGGAGGAP